MIHESSLKWTISCFLWKKKRKWFHFYLLSRVQQRLILSQINIQLSVYNSIALKLANISLESLSIIRFDFKINNIFFLHFNLTCINIRRILQSVNRMHKNSIRFYCRNKYLNKMYSVNMCLHLNGKKSNFINGKINQSKKCLFFPTNFVYALSFAQTWKKFWHLHALSQFILYTNIDGVQWKLTCLK